MGLGSLGCIFLGGVADMNYCRWNSVTNKDKWYGFPHLINCILGFLEYQYNNNSVVWIIVKTVSIDLFVIMSWTFYLWGHETLVIFNSFTVQVLRLCPGTSYYST